MNPRLASEPGVSQDHYSRVFQFPSGQMRINRHSSEKVIGHNIMNVGLVQHGMRNRVTDKPKDETGMQACVASCFVGTTQCSLMV